MDIDLELPSAQENKLDTSLMTNKGDEEPNKSEPRKGLEFETKEEAYAFYREYASSIGFGITIKASRRSKKSGRFIDVKIACSRFGKKKGEAASSSSCTKTDCKASMHIKRRQDDGKWFIYCFVKEHNHEICPRDFVHSKQSSSSCKNIKGVQLALDEADIECLLDNFALIQADNPGFFYALDLDKLDKSLRNVFWVDAKGRQDYSNFHDVVFFDTTTKKYNNIPFALIFGVNNHHQYILMGCALIGEEKYSALVWLFRTWLKAVGGKMPGIIFTYEQQNNPLEEAITEVFPEARRCFSLWHILRRIPENIYTSSSSFTAKFNKCIFRSWTEEEFEKRWWKMIDRFELRGDDWIQYLYVNRNKWAPTYMKDTCLSGLCTTSEGDWIQFFFDKLINKETNTIKKLIDNYRMFLLDTYEEEAKANDCKTQLEEPMLRPELKQLSTVYTRAIFEKYQAEVLGTASCNILHQKECSDERTRRLTFRVNDVEKQENFIVSWDEEKSEISCLCRLFEYRGFLCRHAMVVLEICGISGIPSHYILKRWTKSMSQIITTMPSPNYRVQRFNDLCNLAVKLSERGSLSQETFNITLHGILQALKHCVEVSRNSVRSVRDTKETIIEEEEEEEEENRSSHVAKVAKPKKKNNPRKKQKVQSETECMSTQMQEHSEHMEIFNQRPQAAFDTSSHVPQQGNMQERDMGFRTAPTLDGYFVLPQQSFQAVGQLNFLSSGRDGYYNTQQGMHGLVGQNSFRQPTMHGCFDIPEALQQEEHHVEDTEQSANVTSKHMHDKHLHP